MGLKRRETDINPTALVQWLCVGLVYCGEETTWERLRQLLTSTNAFREFVSDGMIHDDVRESLQQHLQAAESTPEGAIVWLLALKMVDDHLLARRGKAEKAEAGALPSITARP